VLAATLLMPSPAIAQFDLTGSYNAIFHEDQPERIPGPSLGDYVGLPINESARAFAEAGDASRLTPIVDGIDIPDQPRHRLEAGAFAHVPMVLGANRDEGWMFTQRSFPSSVTLDPYSATLDSEFGSDAPAMLAYPAADFASPKDALVAVAGDAESVCEARRVARLIERTGTPVFLYLFDHEVDPVSLDRVVHGLELNLAIDDGWRACADAVGCKSFKGLRKSFKHTGSERVPALAVAAAID
jgi:carboxylesterase type B